jgi:hypothetical protein
MNVIAMFEQLETMVQSVQNLKNINWSDSNYHESVLDYLNRIEDVSRDLQRSMVGDEILSKYRLDAHQQLQRIGELIGEARGIQLFDEQLINLGMACELAVRKINIYNQLANYAERTGMFTGIEATEKA